MDFLIVLVIGFMLVIGGFAALWIIGSIMQTNSLRNLFDQLVVWDGEFFSINFQTMTGVSHNLDLSRDKFYIDRINGIWYSKRFAQDNKKHLADLLETKEKYGHTKMFSDIDEKIEEAARNEWQKIHEDFSVEIENQYQMFIKHFPQFTHTKH